jgi:hypothetical protein
MAAIITPENLTDWLGITDTGDDTNIAIAVASANDAVVAYCGRSFEKVTTATARVFEPRSCTVVDVDDIWDTTGIAVATDGGDDGVYEQTWTASDYILEPLNARKHGLDWPYETIRACRGLTFPEYNKRRASVQVTARWGWAVIPEPVFNATLMKAARLFSRKDSPDGVLGGFSDLGPVRVSLREDPDLQLLLANYGRASTRVLIA